MGNVIMKAQQITYGASNVEKALDDLKAPELIELNKRMDAIDAWKANVHEETYTGSELTIDNALALPARSLITSINAIQDLHGLPFPYVGGAYKNKLDSSAVTQGSFDDPSATANCVSDYTPISGGADYYMSGNSGYADGIYLRFYDANKTELDTSTRISKYVVAFGFTAPSAAIYARIMWYKSGTITPSDIATAQPQLELGTSATSFAPYSNICPISGRDSVVVDDVGKNIWPFGDFIGTYSDVPFSLKAGTYTASKANHDINCGLRFYYADGTSIAFTFFTSETFTLTADVVKINYSSASATTVNFQLERGSTATPYVPYAHSSATIQLGTTVYGADINWDTGVMTVKTALVDLGTLTYTQNGTAQSGKYRYSATITGIKPNTQAGATPNIISSQYKAETPNDSYSAVDGITVVNSDIYTYDSTKNTMSVADFKTAMNGVTAEYELATPTTIQLTPEQLQMLKGYNRVTIESGSIELKALVLGGDN